MNTEQEIKLPVEAEQVDTQMLTPEEEDDIQSGYVPEQDAIPLQLTQIERRVVTQPYDFNVRTIVGQIGDESLIVEPPYQRRYVWDNRRASKLIESLLMNIPIPPIYLAEEESGKYTVIDGQQRLRSIERYIGNKFALRGLNTLTEFDGKSFKDLTEREQRLIQGRTIRCIVIAHESHPEIRFEVFGRLNTGAMQLSDQEIRNALYRGNFNNLIRDLAEQKRWIQALSKTQLDKRMRDDELVLRFFAVHDKYLEYQEPLRAFLDTYMESKTINRQTKQRINLDEQEKKRLSTLFEETVDKVIDVFGDHAFRIYKNGWERQVNRALFDAVMLVFTKLPSKQLISRREKIENALIKLCENQDFVQSVSRGTGSRLSFHTRIKMFSARLARIELDSGIHQTLPDL